MICAPPVSTDYWNGRLSRTRRLLFRTRQTPISMRIGSGLASAKFALFSWLGSASRTTNRQRLFPFGCHGYIMERHPATRWSILIISFISAPVFLCVLLRYGPLRIRCERY
jgi:hypothetical protein